MQIRVSGIISSPSVTTSDVPDGYILAHLFFSVFINGLCDAINYSRYPLLAHDIKIYLTIYCPEDYNLVESDTDPVEGRCTAVRNLALTKQNLHPSQGNLTCSYKNIKL